MSNLILVKIVGEPWLSRAREYREQMIAFTTAWSDYARSLGATGLTNAFPGHRMRGLFFEKAPPPAGWKKPDRKGFATPKKGSPAAEEFARLPVKPRNKHVFGDAIVCDLTWEAPNGAWGGGAIGFMIEGVSIGWVGDVLIARIPHAGRAAAEHLARHPDHIIRHGAADWTIPDGLVEISQAELDLLDAQYRLARERAAS
ncbi:hypothetical protein [Bosea minatitlanensis]|uniref:ASCH domain-containing protein n=1 Tax=Bosea minatitlanensis TaxID=128782 RepID=A0ABW0F1M9_9HYPH|nr:hypothetical protein [Bosea minatitlanensis]MCT4491776.1 hypothetical protein [Bosea minatitlanensis]